MKILNKVITFTAVMMLMFFNSMAFAVENVTGVVNTETLRLRKEASTESAVLELLSKDEKVDVLEEKDGWYKVKFKDYTGYVSKEFITLSGDVKSLTNAETQNNNQNNNTQGTVQITQKDAKTSADTKLYILPLINAKTVSEIKKDTKITIVNVVGGWAYVNAENISGWIRIDKLTLIDSNSSENNKEENKNETEQTKNDENQNEEKDVVKKEETVKEEQNTFEARTAYIKEALVNVRSSATTNSNVIITLSQNTEIKLVGEEENWYKVEVSGKNGYILKTLVSSQKTEVTSRSAVQTREVNQTNNITSIAQETKTIEQNTTSEKQNATTNNATEAKKEAENIEEQKTETVTESTISKGEEVVEYAKQFLGCPYVYGGSGPSVFDCSGFTMFVYKHFGVSIGHSAVTQAYVGRYVPRSELQPGDLIIINNESNTSIGHVGMYVGGGNFIHASSGSGQIVISPLSNAYYNARYVTARRIF